MARLVTLRNRVGTVTGPLQDDPGVNSTALVIQLESTAGGIRPSSIAGHVLAIGPVTGNGAQARLVLAQLSRLIDPVRDGTALFNWLGPGILTIGNLADQSQTLSCDELLFAGFACQGGNVAGAAGTIQLSNSPAQFRWEFSEAPIIPAGKFLAAILVTMGGAVPNSSIEGMLTFYQHVTDPLGRAIEGQSLLLEGRP